MLYAFNAAQDAMLKSMYPQHKQVQWTIANLFRHSRRVEERPEKPERPWWTLSEDARRRLARLIINDRRLNSAGDDLYHRRTVDDIELIHTPGHWT